MRWVDALKQWNAHHKSVNTAHVWMVPRKGTAEHAEVKHIMDRTKPAAIEAENVARREKSIAQLREATKGMKPGRPPERDYEAENVARREKSIAQLREATKGMKPGVRKDVKFAPTLKEMYEVSNTSLPGSNQYTVEESDRVYNRTRLGKWVVALAKDDKDDFGSIKRLISTIYGNIAAGHSVRIGMFGNRGEDGEWWRTIIDDLKLPGAYRLSLTPRVGTTDMYGSPLDAEERKDITTEVILRNGNAPLQTTSRSGRDADLSADEVVRPPYQTEPQIVEQRLRMSAAEHLAHPAKMVEDAKRIAREKVEAEEADKKKAKAIKAKVAREQAKANPALKEAEAKELEDARRLRESASKKPTEITAESASRLPTDVVESNIMPFIKGKEFNLAKVFLSAPNGIRRRAIGVIALLNGIGKMDDNVFVAKSNENPELRLFADALKPFIDGLKINREMEVPSREQKQMLENGFPPYLSIDFYRRQGSMGNKSGIVSRPSVSTTGLNLRTKAGREEKEAREKEVMRLANSYLDRIAAKGAEFAKFIIGKSEGMEKVRATKKAEARATVDFAKSKDDASYVMPDKFYEVAYAFMGDEGRARKYANDLSEKAKGRPVKFWLPRGKNLLASF